MSAIDYQVRIVAFCKISKTWFLCSFFKNFLSKAMQVFCYIFEDFKCEQERTLKNHEIFLKFGKKCLQTQNQK